MPKKTHAKNSLRTSAAAAGAVKHGRGVRYSPEQVQEHVQRYRAISSKTGITQQKYADDNRISVGTLSRWLSENPLTDDRPVRALLPAGADDVALPREPKVRNGVALVTAPEVPMPVSPSIEELQAVIDDERAAKRAVELELQQALMRNGELKTAIKNLTGSL